MKKIFLYILITLLFIIFIGIMYYIPNRDIKGIYSALENPKSDYMKNKRSDIEYEEYAIHNKIIIKIDNKEEYTFFQEGDYIIYKDNINNINKGLEYYKYIINAVVLCQGMDSKLVNIYIDYMIEENKSSKYFSINKDNDIVTYKYYIRERFDIPKMDIYIKEGDVLAYLDKIDEGFSLEKGKIRLNVSRNSDKDIIIVVSEYLGHSDLMYKSIINTVKDIKPVNYEMFLEEFHSLIQISRKYRSYSVKKLSNEIAKSELSYYEKEYNYMRIIFRDE